MGLEERGLDSGYPAKDSKFLGPCGAMKKHVQGVGEVRNH
jgi:hypothetical protein